jgi:parvulin-like peptidyl-prolyl isomerase
MIRFAFDNDLGDISNVFKIDAGYVVAMVSNVIEPGFKNFEDVKSQIESLVKVEKKKDYAMELAAQARSKIGDSDKLNLAIDVFPKAVVSSAQGFTPLDVIPGIGKEPKFIEYCLNAELNKISDPIRGARGAYLIRLTDRTPFDSTSYKIQHNSLRDQIMQSKKARNYSQWLQAIKKEADIVDERYLFYR